VLASNIDTLLIVNALDGGRNFLPSMIERALILARHSLSSPHIILNKADLASEEVKEKALRECEISFPSIPCTLVSAKTGEGLQELSSYLTSGTTAGMLGKSGMGKSALVNALGKFPARDEDDVAGQNVLEGEVRKADLRGRHTTTSSRLYKLPSGLLIIDSPGIRELKLWGTEEDVEESFADIASLSSECRFQTVLIQGNPAVQYKKPLYQGNLNKRVI
jgi:ribosome biogenesis GTPase / thiamine phosphate phosphatase